MKKSSSLFLSIFTLLLITSLSFLYWSNVKERLHATSALTTITTPIFSIPTSSKSLILTIDVDASTNQIANLLTVLDTHQTKATFFITGKWLDKNPEQAKAILQKGHELGNHTEDHLDMTRLTEQEQEQQILLLHQKVLTATQYSMTLFRPPFNAYDYSVIQTAKKNDYQAISWSIDSEDWKDYSAQDIISKIKNHPNLTNGSILSFHASGLHTVEALDLLLPFLLEKGYHFSSVSELQNNA